MKKEMIDQMLHEHISEEGIAAYHEGFDIADVPYDRGTFARAAWLQGYCAAEKEAK